MAVEDVDPRVLCQGPLGAVTVCSACGQVHLLLGYVTLRLEPDAFRELTGMLAVALQRLPAPLSSEQALQVPQAALH